MNASNRPSLGLVTVLVLLALLFFVDAGAVADVIHLRTGETVKGRPLRDRSDKDVLVMEDYLSGAVRSLAWAVVEEADKLRLQREWGWMNRALEAVKGHRLVQQLAGGATQDVRGIIVKEDDVNYHVQLGGRVVKVRKDQVLERVDEDMDPRDIWSPEQLVERFRAELAKEEGVDLDNPDGHVHWRIAEYARQAGDFATAKTHYEACASDETYQNATVAKQRLADVEAILRDAAALRSLRDIRMALSLKSFEKVREGIEGFGEKHPDAGEQIQQRLEKTKADFVKRRAEFFQLEAKINFPKIVLKEIKTKVQEKEIGLSDVTAWTRRELPDGAFEALAVRLQRRDEAVTPEEARAFWENRRKSGWRMASYGAGTFIVEPPKIKPPKRRAPRKRRSGSGGAAPQVKIPKPPTRDQWWAAAATKERQQWVMAFFVENSGLFELGKPKYSLCPKCNGAGLESKALQTGGTMSYLCTRCGGAQRDKRVRFR
ncbi:MAG: hypothetical protein QNJ90_00065 [Planctomycetota bacterium]|nr:hypothetical protein [Planctomycetota bacterium]